MELIWNFNICPENRGWIVDKVSAIIDGKEVGYLKVENVPSTEFNKRYTSIFDFVQKIAGFSFLAKDVDSVKEHLTYDLLKSKWGPIDYMGPDPSRSFKDLLKEMERFLNRRYGKSFRQFKQNHVDNPFPAYISVLPEYRRRGIAASLYIEAAKHYAEKGLVLRSSSCRTYEATSVWKKLESLGLVKFNSKRNYYLFK